ncbi:MAG: hypothetical protein DI537_11380 [Stutzerimonas stutzeri]|nr:MAG: hypothetical protein DI537_11380 [Stutzerimonas stutzeri]
MSWLVSAGAWFFGTKVGRWLATAAAVAIGAALIVWRVFAAGKSAARNEQKEKVDAVRREWNKIDGERPDFDASLGRLRDRSRK